MGGSTAPIAAHSCGLALPDTLHDACNPVMTPLGAPGRVQAAGPLLALCTAPDLANAGALNSWCLWQSNLRCRDLSKPPVPAARAAALCRLHTCCHSHPCLPDSGLQRQHAVAGHRSVRLSHTPKFIAAPEGGAPAPAEPPPLLLPPAVLLALRPPGLPAPLQRRPCQQPRPGLPPSAAP